MAETELRTRRPRLLKAPQAALHLGMSPPKFRKAAKAGKIPGEVYLPEYKRPRYDVAALDAMIAGQTGEAAARSGREKALAAVDAW